MNYNNLSIHEVFGEYLKIQPDSEELYYPDMFIKDIHKAYLDDNKVSLPMPLYATWDIVDECNLRCLFCSAAAPKTKKEFVSSSIALKIADKIIENGIKYVSIRGGEPSLCKELPEVVKTLLWAGIFVEVVTNGKNITQEFFDKIGEIPLSLFRIKISLDSSNIETNDYQRGDKSHYYATKAMNCCKINNIPFRVQMVLTNCNYLDIKDTYMLCVEKGAISFGCIILLPIGRGKKSKLRISLNKEILIQLIEIIKLKKETIVEKIGLGVDAIKMYKPYISEMEISYSEALKNGHLKCNGLKTRIYINSKGEIYPCDLLQYDEYNVGNICEGTKYWNNIKAEKFRMQNRSNMDKCKDCKIYGCNMGCLAISIENSENSSSLVPNCEV